MDYAANTQTCQFCLAVEFFSMFQVDNNTNYTKKISEYLRSSRDIFAQHDHPLSVTRNIIEITIT